MFTDEEKQWLIVVLSELQFKAGAIRQHLLCNDILKKLSLPKLEKNEAHK